MLHALDHFTVRAIDLDRSLAFYCGVLGLERGARPAFGVPGHWLYAAGRPLVHLLPAAGDVAIADVAPGGDGHAARAGLDHVAFQASARADLQARLVQAGLGFTEHELPDGSALQLFVQDPNGTQLELVFRAPADRRP